MRLWGAAALLALAGCTTGITAPMDMGAGGDLSATANDMASGCTLAFSGDINMTVPCRIFLCHPTGGTENYDDLDLAGPIDNPMGAHAIFDVDGMFALKSYTRAELRTLDVGIFTATKTYRAGDAFGTGTLTVTDITRPSASPCDGSAHGAATATLDEIVDEDGGTQTSGPGRVMMTATF